MYPRMKAMIILTAVIFNDNVTVTLHFQKTTLAPLRKHCQQLVSTCFNQTSEEVPGVW